MARPVLQGIGKSSVSDPDSPAPSRSTPPLTVVLVRPPQRVSRTTHARLAVPPLGLAYLGAALLAKGHRVSMVDCVGEAPFQVEPVDRRFVRYGLADHEMIERIPADTRLIGVNCMFSEEWPLLRHTLQVLRQAFPSAVVVAGGEHITAMPEHSLRESGIDLCVLGEGEDTLVEIAERLGRGEDPREAAGVAFIDEHGVFHSTNRRARIRDLDRLAHPAWHLVPMENYLKHGFKYGLGNGRTVPLMVSRGCPYQCTFCSSPRMWTTRWVARDPDDVLREMEAAIQDWGAENFDLYDLTAMIKREWIVEFSTKLIERNWGVTWQIPSGTRSEVLDDEALSLLKRAGCSFLPYAPESGSPRLLTLLKKRVHLDRMKVSIRSAVRAGHQVKCNIVMGFPEETRADMWKTVWFCSQIAALGVHDIHVLAFCPYPGSELHDQFVKTGRIASIDDTYFDRLAGMAELSEGEHWSDHVSARELYLMRMLTLATFYSLSFLIRPWRFVSFVGDLLEGNNKSRLAKAVREIISRKVASRRAAGKVAVPPAPPERPGPKAAMPPASKGPATLGVERGTMVQLGIGGSDR